LILGFILYNISYLFFGHYILIISIFDSIYFLKNYLDKTKNKINYKLFKNIIKNVDKIDKDNIIEIDPEFKKDKYKPYKSNLKDIFIDISNNIIT
jgi:hypothetical protein